MGLDLDGVVGAGDLGVPGHAVEADDGVEVDDAAGLVFRDLDVPDCDLGAERLEGGPGEPGEVAGQVGGEPAPDPGGVRVEQDGGGVVVAVAAQRQPEPGVGVGVPFGERSRRVPMAGPAPLGGLAGDAPSSVPQGRVEWACAHSTFG
jgi:hypothetical protein